MLGKHVTDGRGWDQKWSPVRDTSQHLFTACDLFIFRSLFLRKGNIKQSAVCLRTQSHHSYGKYHPCKNLENCIKVLQIFVVYVAFVLCRNPSSFRYCAHKCRTQQRIELNVKERFCNDQPSRNFYTREVVSFKIVFSSNQGLR